MYTTKQIAEMLGYTDDRYIRRLIKQGKLHAQRVNPRLWIVTKKQLENFQLKKRLDLVHRDITKAQQSEDS